MVSSPRSINLRSVLLTSSLSGIVDIVSSIYEGFSNMPRLYGSKVRKRGEVKDFSSGVNEGAKVRDSFSS